MVYISANKEDLMDDISLLTMYANTTEEIDDRRSSRRSSTIRPLVVGIAGGSGSGITTLAEAIVNQPGKDNITLLSHDLYYHDLSHKVMSEREKANFDHPDSLDTALLVDHVKTLANGGQVVIPQYDYTTHSRITGL